MKTIEENNKLIAKFMGSPYEWDNNEKAWYDNDQMLVGIELKYHSSWDWLMPVFRIITELGISFDEEGGDLIEICADAITDVSIVDAYQAVVQFIEWYNEQMLKFMKMN